MNERDERIVQLKVKLGEITRDLPRRPYIVLYALNDTAYRAIMQLEIFPDQARLRRVCQARNMRRFYKMVVQRDLFGGASLVREWGRIGSPGQVRIDHHLDEGQAVDALAELTVAKRRRGYL